MHSNAAHTRRFGYAAIFGRGGLLACTTAKIFMAALMILPLLTTTAQAEGIVKTIIEETGRWIIYGESSLNGTAASAAEACETVGRRMQGFTWWHGVFVGTSPNATFYVGLGMLDCRFRDSVTGITAIQNGVYPLTRRVCPSNSTEVIGSCTCNTNFKPDPTATSCIPVVQYTIALHDLNVGGDLATLASRAAYAQVMEGAVAKSGIAVTLITTASSPGAGTAILSPTAGSTGGDGRLNFTFTAPPVGGTHTVTATCDGGKCSNQATGTIVVTACPVKDLTSLDELSKKVGETPEQAQLTQQLESGVDAYNLLSPATQTAEQCLAGRIRATTVNYSGTTSTVRTLAYQKHLRNVWDKFFDLKSRVAADPSIQQTCQTLITKVEGEMGFRLNQNPTDDDEVCAAPGRRHCLVSEPGGGVNPLHTQNIAFDISRSTVAAFIRRLNQQQPRRTVQQEANACGLDWGGVTIRPSDPVHFLLR